MIRISVAYITYKADELFCTSRLPQADVIKINTDYTPNQPTDNVFANYANTLHKSRPPRLVTHTQTRTHAHTQCQRVKPFVEKYKLYRIYLKITRIQ